MEIEELTSENEEMADKIKEQRDRLHQYEIQINTTQDSTST